MIQIHRFVLITHLLFTPLIFAESVKTDSSSIVYDSIIKGGELPQSTNPPCWYQEIIEPIKSRDKKCNYFVLVSTFGSENMEIANHINFEYKKAGILAIPTKNRFNLPALRESPRRKVAIKYERFKYGNIGFPILNNSHQLIDDPITLVIDRNYRIVYSCYASQNDMNLIHALNILSGGGQLTTVNSQKYFKNQLEVSRNLMDINKLIDMGEINSLIKFSTSYLPSNFREDNLALYEFFLKSKCINNDMRGAVDLFSKIYYYDFMQYGSREMEYKTSETVVRSALYLIESFPDKNEVIKVVDDFSKTNESMFSRLRSSQAKWSVAVLFSILKKKDRSIDFANRSIDLIPSEDKKIYAKKSLQSYVLGSLKTLPRYQDGVLEKTIIELIEKNDLVGLSKYGKSKIQFQLDLNGDNIIEVSLKKSSKIEMLKYWISFFEKEESRKMMNDLEVDDLLRRPLIYLIAKNDVDRLRIISSSSLITPELKLEASFYAAKYGNMEILSILIGKNLVDENYSKGLMDIAVISNHLNLVKFYAQKGNDYNSRLIKISISLGMNDIAKFLIQENGFQDSLIESKLYDNESYLSLSILVGNHEMEDYCINNDNNLSDKFAHASRIAIESNRLDLLIKFKAAGWMPGNNSFKSSVKARNMEICNFIIDSGADISEALRSHYPDLPEYFKDYLKSLKK
jgi:hypothetical protein